MYFMTHIGKGGPRLFLICTILLCSTKEVLGDNSALACGFLYPRSQEMVTYAGLAAVQSATSLFTGKVKEAAVPRRHGHHTLYRESNAILRYCEQFQCIILDLVQNKSKCRY